MPVTDAELIERLEGLQGPDGKVDHLLFMMENGYTRVDEDFDSTGMRYYAWRRDKYAGEITLTQRLAYTASLDAAVACFERLLPNTEERIYSPMIRTGAVPSAQIFYAQRDPNAKSGWAVGALNPREERGANAAISLLLAAFRARNADVGEHRQTSSGIGPGTRNDVAEGHDKATRAAILPVQRYAHLQVHNCGQQPRGEMREDENGEWVLFEDHLRAVNSLVSGRDIEGSDIA